MDRRRFADRGLTDGGWLPPSACSWEAAASVAATLLTNVIGGGRDEPDTSAMDAELAERRAEADAEQEEQRQRLEARRRSARQGGAFGRLLLTRGGARGLLG